MSTLLLLAQAQENGVFIFGGAMMIIVAVLALLASIFWLWMLIDVLTSPLPAGEKILWFLVIFFLHLIGALIYYIIRRPGAPMLSRT